MIRPPTRRVDTPQLVAHTCSLHNSRRLRVNIKGDNEMWRLQPHVPAATIIGKRYVERFGKVLAQEV